ncbi:MAG: hypothetical protein U0232_16995 [Thermomicrobiales bacterium]
MSDDTAATSVATALVSANSALSTQYSALPDIIAPNLALLFVGYNPSVHSARRGHFITPSGNPVLATTDIGWVDRASSPPRRTAISWRSASASPASAPSPPPASTICPVLSPNPVAAPWTAKIEHYRPRISSPSTAKPPSTYFGRPHRLGRARSPHRRRPQPRLRHPLLLRPRQRVQSHREAAYLALGTLVLAAPSPHLSDA